MSKNFKIIVLNLPSPPHRYVGRDWAGGFGTLGFSTKSVFGRGNSPMLLPFLPYISSAIMQAEYEFKVIDCDRLRLDQYHCLKNLNHENPDIVVSLINLPSMKEDVALLKKVKESLPNTFIVGVGTTCKVLPSEVLLKGGVDAVLRSSYPYVSNLIDLVRALQQSWGKLKMVNSVSYLQDGKVISTPESPEISLDEIPPPSYDALELVGYNSSFMDTNGEQYQFIPILGSKGCPYTCVYCPYRVGFGERWSRRKPKDIVDEMELLQKTTSIKGFLFRDQSFTMNKKHAIEVCDEILRKKLDVAWFCEARVNECSRELLEKMKKSGCKSIHYGVETGDIELVEMAKPGATLENTRKAFRLTKEYGLWTEAHIVLGWPDETQQTLRRTFKFIQELDPHGVNWNILTPYPGTKLYEVARRNSWILTYDWSKYTSSTIVMRPKNLSEVQLYAAIQRTFRDYSKLRIKKLLKEVYPGIRKPRFLISELLTCFASYTQTPLQ